MSVFDVVIRRKIPEVVHFTTNVGLVGILGSRAVLSRHRLPATKYVEHVYEPNAKVRRDGPWLDYVNLSITRLNWEFFGHSRRWHAHRDAWWCALAFDPVILDGDGVVFATTNNIYTGCNHGSGEAGIEAMFAPRVLRWPGNFAERYPGMPENWTTCHQAEVLIPRQVDIARLRRVIVATDAHSDIAYSQCEILLGDVPINVDPDAFEPTSRA